MKDRDRQQRAITLADAMAESRRLLVTGDLGSGKTTLTARLVSDLSTRGAQTFAMFVPARALALDDRTAADFLTSLSRFASGDVGPALPPLDLRSLLDDGVETVLVIDGIDEVGADKAKRILHFLDRIVASWPNTAVIATTRPIEAGTLDLATWDVLATAPMDYGDWRDLFTSEARAAGLSAKDADDRSNVLAERVRRTSALTNLAGTPLGARLLARNLFDERATSRNQRSVTFSMALSKNASGRGQIGRAGPGPPNYSKTRCRTPPAEAGFWVVWRP